jgi:hypothetical protein
MFFSKNVRSTGFSAAREDRGKPASCTSTSNHKRDEDIIQPWESADFALERAAFG